MFRAYEIERRPRGASRSACLGIFIALEIERRPRGASRASPLLHLLQRAMACEAIVACLVGTTQFLGWRCRRPTCLQPCAKANNHGLTGTARCNKCGSGLAPRSAARAALDLKGAKDLKASAPRSAARAALDLCITKKSKPGPGSPNSISRKSTANPLKSAYACPGSGWWSAVSLPRPARVGYWPPTRPGSAG